MPSFFGARPVRGGGAARSGDHDAPATAPVRLAWTQGRCHREGGSHRSCLGVLVGVPDRWVAIDPVRRIKPRPSPLSGSRSAGAGCLWLSRRSSVVTSRGAW